MELTEDPQELAKKFRAQVPRFYELAGGRVMSHEPFKGIVRGTELTDKGLLVHFQPHVNEENRDAVSKFLVSVHNNFFYKRKLSGVNIGRYPENHSKVLLSTGVQPLITKEEFEQFKPRIMNLEPFDGWKQWIYSIKEKRNERKVYIQFIRNVPERVIEAVHKKVNEIADLYFGEQRQGGLATSWDRKPSRPRIDIWCADMGKWGK